MWFLAATLLSLVAMGLCGNYTVTDEAWFEVEIKDLDGPGLDYRGRYTIALFGDVAPMTVLNFKSITKGFKHGRSKLHYKGSNIHRVVPDFVVQMGDVTKGDGSGGRSIYGEKFIDEEFVLSHQSAGWVSMANHGRDSNGSQFFIMLTKARWLDGKHVVFGKVVKGFDVVHVMSDVPSDPDTSVPKRRMRIVDCGMNDLQKTYDLKTDQLQSVEDL